MPHTLEEDGTLREMTYPTEEEFNLDPEDHIVVCVPKDKRVENSGHPGGL